ncbi:hypothetical protein ACPPVT_19820 [Angustibacter sp. McL0619]|uniref:hypothetical protein n=1 Tax=Angustibacter sp. McL0619 TaxID=3415676 RepID=UPI003CED9BFE
MINTEATCTALQLAGSQFAVYPATAVEAVPDPTVDAPQGSQAQRIWRLEIIHTDGDCRVAMADTCVVITATDPGLRFVDPGSAARANYISYWAHPENPAPDDPPWEPMADGTRTPGPAVCIVAQTLPAEIGVGAGAGYLHYLPDRPSDGWTVGVGAWHENGPDALTGAQLSVIVSARPDWSGSTAAVAVVAP